MSAPPEELLSLVDDLRSPDPVVRDTGAFTSLAAFAGSTFSLSARSHACMRSFATLAVAAAVTVTVDTGDTIDIAGVACTGVCAAAGPSVNTARVATNIRTKLRAGIDAWCCMESP